MQMILGVSASIALYKSCDLVRLLSKNGISVTVVMTPTAASWISPLVFSALSGNPVYVAETDHSMTMAHIELRKGRRLMLIAPASADIISHVATGAAPTLLSALALAFDGQKWLAPAMNPSMYAHPAVQKNISLLKDYGYHILSPETGEALCGDLGEGKMAPVEDILDKILAFREQSKS